MLEGISLRSRVLRRSASATLSPGSLPAHARTCRVHLPSAAEACARSPSSSAAILGLLDALSSDYTRAGLVGRRAAVVERGRGARARGHRLESYSVQSRVRPSSEGLCATCCDVSPLIHHIRYFTWSLVCYTGRAQSAKSRARISSRARLEKKPPPKAEVRAKIHHFSTF